MKKEWFEKNMDGEIPFVKAALNTTADLPVWETIAAAFRALLAEEQAAAPVVHVDLPSQPDVTRAVQLDEHGNILQEVGVTHDGGQVLSVQPAPPALQVGDVVRLEPCPEREGHVDTRLFVGRVDAIEKMANTWDIRKPCAWFTIPNTTTGQGIWWPVDSLTLIRRAGEVQSVDTQRSIAAALANGQLSLQDEITGLRGEVERLQGELQHCNHMNRDLTTERDALQAYLRDEQAKRASIEAELAACRESCDALQARIDAGVRVYGYESCSNGEMWAHDQMPFSRHTALLIDVRPIDQPDHIPDAGEMADERKGERRQIKPRHDDPFRRYADSDRRRTPGTRADRRDA